MLLYNVYHFGSDSTLLKRYNRIKKPLYDEHYRGILVTFLGVTEHFSGENGASRWSILVGKQKHNVQRPTHGAYFSRFYAEI